MFRIFWDFYRVNGGIPSFPDQSLMFAGYTQSSFLKTSVSWECPGVMNLTQHWWKWVVDWFLEVYPVYGPVLNRSSQFGEASLVWECPEKDVLPNLYWLNSWSIYILFYCLEKVNKYYRHLGIRIFNWYVTYSIISISFLSPFPNRQTTFRSRMSFLQWHQRLPLFSPVV